MLRIWRIHPIRNAYFARAVLVWIALRLGSGFLRIPNPSAPQELLIVVAVTLAVLIDARRRKEDLFLGNLCIPAGAIAAVAALPPVLLELLIP